MYLKNLESQNSQNESNFVQNSDSFLEKNAQKTEEFSEFCVLEGISDRKCTQKLKGSQTCYIESCKHCCFVTVNGHSACINKCDAMRSLIGG